MEWAKVLSPKVKPFLPHVNPCLPSAVWLI